jgi:hypothetical protein
MTRRDFLDDGVGLGRLMLRACGNGWPPRAARKLATGSKHTASLGE